MPVPPLLDRTFHTSAQRGDSPLVTRQPNRQEPPETVDIDTVLDRLDDLEAAVDSEAERREVRETKHLVDRLPNHLSDRQVFGNRVRKYTTRDMAEAFVGSIIIALPLLVEDGVYEIGDHLAETTVAGLPVFFIGNVVFIVAIVIGLLYYANLQQVETTDPLFGVVPRRLVGVLTISFITSAIMMTLWGRVEGWQDPWIAICRISVVWAGGAFGAALGDILPGESSDRDIGSKLME
jgi:uncharacterized membrane protein